MKQNLYDGTLDKDARVLLEKDDSIAYHVQNNDGELSITEHHVFPGIWLIYKHAHAQKYRYPPDYPSGLLEITHCREGRFEYQAGDRIFYLSEGDVSVGNSTDAAVVYCPTRHYRGVSVILDPALAPRCLSCFLDDVNVSPFALLKKFCGENKHFIMRSTSQLEHIFSEIYSVPEHLKKGYLKVKILELLLFLSDLDPKLSQSEQRCCTKAQVELAKQVCGLYQCEYEYSSDHRAAGRKIFCISRPAEKVLLQRLRRIGIRLYQSLQNAIGSPSFENNGSDHFRDCQ